MEFVLAKIPKYNRLTNEKEGEELALIKLDYTAIKTIVADSETGNAIIHYFVDPKPLETAISFIELFDQLHRHGLVQTHLVNKVKSISKTFTNHIENNHGL